MSQNPTTIIEQARLFRHALRTKARSGSLAYFALFLTSFVWGTTWLASKIGIQQVHPLFFSALRQTIGGSLFLVFFWLRGRAVWPPKSEWNYIVMGALLLFVLSNGLTTWGIKYISSGLGSILGAIFPLVVALIEWVGGSKHQKPGKMATIGLLLGFAGVGVIFMDHFSDFANPQFTIGIVLSLAAAVSWAFGTLYTARNTTQLNRYYALGWQMFTAGLLLLVVSLASGVAIPLAAVPVATWQAMAYMVVFGSIITFGALLYSLQHLPPAVASLYAYFNPMVAVVAGHFVLGEPWSFQLLIGGLITLLGVYLVKRGYNKGTA